MLGTEERFIDDDPWNGIANDVDSYLNFHSLIFDCTELANERYSAQVFWLVSAVYGAIHSMLNLSCSMMKICFSAFYESQFRLRRHLHFHPTRFQFWNLACRRTYVAIHVACVEASVPIPAFLHHVPAVAVFAFQAFQFQLFYQLCLLIKISFNSENFKKFPSYIACLTAAAFSSSIFPSDCLSLDHQLSIATIQSKVNNKKNRLQF